MSCRLDVKAAYKYSTVQYMLCTQLCPCDTVKPSPSPLPAPSMQHDNRKIFPSSCCHLQTPCLPEGRKTAHQLGVTSGCQSAHKRPPRARPALLSHRDKKHGRGIMAPAKVECSEASESEREEDGEEKPPASGAPPATRQPALTEPPGAIARLPLRLSPDWT